MNRTKTRNRLAELPPVNPAGGTAEQDAEGARQHGRKGLLAIATKYGARQSGTHSIRVPVRITDHKLAYGRLRLKAEPIGGEGFWWVEAGTKNLVLE